MSITIVYTRADWKKEKGSSTHILPRPFPCHMACAKINQSSHLFATSHDVNRLQSRANIPSVKSQNCFFFNNQYNIDSFFCHLTEPDYNIIINDLTADGIAFTEWDRN